MNKFITIVGLDTHKDSIEIVTAETTSKQEVRNYGKIGGDMASLDKAIRKLQSTGAELHFVYEAGPCGYEIYRHLTQKGFQCAVVAPSMVPKRSGNRIKTDRRDAEALARLHRAGELTPIYVPREDDEAMRDLSRAREDASKAQRTARQRLGAMLLRHGYRYPGKKSGPRLICVGSRISPCRIQPSRSRSRNTSTPSWNAPRGRIDWRNRCCRFFLSGGWPR